MPLLVCRSSSTTHPPPADAATAATMARCGVPHLDPPPIGLCGGPPQIRAAFVGGFLPQARHRATTASSPRGDRRRSRSTAPTLSQWSPSSVEARSGTVMARSEKEGTDGDFQDGKAWIFMTVKKLLCFYLRMYNTFPRDADLGPASKKMARSFFLFYFILLIGRLVWLQ